MLRRAGTPGESRRSDRALGQSLVELALVAPIIILLLTALVQFALIFERQIGIENAVRDAARSAAALETKNTTDAQNNANFALTTLQALLANSQTHDGTRDAIEVCIVTPSTNTVDAAGNAQVVVRIKESYRHPVFLPLIAQIIDGIDGANDDALKVTTSVEFHVEQASPYPNIGAGAAARYPANFAQCTP